MGNEINQIYTPIVQTTHFKHSDFENPVYIVLEDYYAYPEGQSNLYACHQDGTILWKAELPDPTDTYVQEFKWSMDYIIVHTWSGWRCEINPSNGKIVSKTESR